METLAHHRLGCKGHRARYHADFSVQRALDAAREVLAGSGGGAPKAAVRSAAFNALGLPAAAVDAIERELTVMVPTAAMPEFRRTLTEFDRLRRARVRRAVHQPPRVTRPHLARTGRPVGTR